jgi:uncharacterized protein YkwD
MGTYRIVPNFLLLGGNMFKRCTIALAIGLSVLVLFSTAQGWVVADPPPVLGATPTPIASTGGGGPAICYTGCGGVNAPLINAAHEQQVVELVNAERAARGIPPLKRATELDEAARYHATDMGQDNYFDHDTYDAGNPSPVCSWVQRIETYYANWLSLAENIAAGQRTPQAVMNTWMDSGGHKANILNTNVWEIGVGYYEDSGNTHRYWAQDFGRRSGVYPLVIMGEAATIDVADVSLYIYGPWDEVRLRNDSGAWSAWMPFQNEMNWTLGTGVGTRTVEAEMRTAGQTASASDTIYLTVSPVPSLGNLPDALYFTYSIPDARLVPASSRVRPENDGTSDALTWSVTTEGAWFTASPLGGVTTSEDTITITPGAFDTATVATYTGAITVTVTDPSDVEGSPHQIDLTLNVIDSPIYDVYLPTLLKNHVP